MMHRKATRTVIPIREDGVSCRYPEPTLEEMLSDSIVEAVMEADAVDPGELGAMLSDIARALHRAGRGDAPNSVS